jgi:hypothetical protein
VRCVASGLYYLSELVEEHTVLAKKLLYRLIYGVVGLQVLLLVVDGFPVALSALSVVSHVIYAQNLRRFPIVKLTDPLFLLSCGTLLLPGAQRNLFVRLRGLADRPYSPRDREPLLLVPPLQRATSGFIVLLVSLFSRREYPLLH